MNPAIPFQPAPTPWRLLNRLVYLLSPNRGGLWLCVVLPTLLVGIYQFAVASDIYISESAFGVRIDSGQQAPEIGLMIPGLHYNSGQYDQLTVNTYLQSAGMIDALKDSVTLRNIFTTPKADSLARLPADASNETFLDYFRTMLSLRYDERAQITHLKVRAFTPEEAQTLNEAMLAEAERFVNQLSSRMRSEGITFAEEQVKLAENELVAANEALSGFREEKRNFDPTQTSQGVASILQTLQGQIVAKRAELGAARGSMTEQHPSVRRLRNEIYALEQQLAIENARLVSSNPDTLGQQIEDFTTVELRHEFAVKRYGMAITALEAAQAEASRKSVYLTRITAPNLPDEALEPKRLYHTASTFFLTLAGYALLLLIAASIGDHIRK